jgi:folate-binding protein YgfZ
VENTKVRENVVTLAVLRIHGRDAATFLQGQLSSDVAALAGGASQLAGYHNPQGRVIALLRLSRVAPEDLLAQLPLELALPVAQRLRRYILRAKLAIDIFDSPTALTAALPQISLPDGWNATCSRDADIAAGLPQVYAATSEQFVAQMLNLDCIGAISFSKGCYTGQEVIARAHYRGRVKRRMRRFVTRTAVAAATAQTPLVPGASIRLPDGRRLEVVDAVERTDGRVEFLAVAPFGPAAAESAPNTGSAEPTPLDCEPLTLPYALPD